MELKMGLLKITILVAHFMKHEFYDTTSELGGWTGSYNTKVTYFLYSANANIYIFLAFFDIIFLTYWN